MARRTISSGSPPVPPPAPSKKLSSTELRLGIERLIKRREELRAFDLGRVAREDLPELTALSASISSALSKTFGEDTAEHRRFLGDKNLNWSPMVMYPGMNLTNSEFRKGVKGKIDKSEALLGEAIKGLQEDFAEQSAQLENLGTPSEPRRNTDNRKIFVVHGHDQAMRESVARFLEKLKFEPIILHQQANQGRTIIEKIERNSDVGFAVVLLSGDDIGGKTIDQIRPRARQNVILELGYFIALLKRDRVCALKVGDVEVPSDFDGVVYVDFDDAGGWKTALARELTAVGYAIDGHDLIRA